MITFITPFGQYCFNRVPFGITSAPEYFQKRMSQILAGLPGVVCMIDDTLVYGGTQEEHDRSLKAVLHRIKEEGGTLNFEKCTFSHHTVKFLGHIIGPEGIAADPDKLEEIQKMKAPTNVSEVRRFLGIVTQLSKFIPQNADISKPLRELLRHNNQWVWSEYQQAAFERLKQYLVSPPVLAKYDPRKETKVAADASQYGIGAVLIQKQDDGTYRPVTYASRALTLTEQRYAQVEKEGLAVNWACERFRDYLIGIAFHIETDHKPLVSLLGKKNLDELTPRIQRFRMRLMGYKYSISHLPGKDLITADALSRAPVTQPSRQDDVLIQEVQAFVDLIISSFPQLKRC